MRRFFLALATICTPAFAVIIDSAVPGFTTGSSAFTGVVAIYFNAGAGSSLCTGSLIATDLILTAGHCVDGASNWQVRFDTPTSNATIGVSQAYLHPDYAFRPSPLNTLPEFDVALLRLSSAAPVDAQIYGIVSDTTGLRTTSQANPTWLDIVGFGRYGVAGTTPQLDFANPTRHWARNTLDGIAGSLNGVATPDLPLILTTNFSNAAANEGLTGPGDSGGPLLFGNYILGVASAGDLPRTGAISTTTTYTNIHADLLEYNTGTWVESFLVPEPGTFVLAAAGLLVVFSSRRRKRSSSDHLQ